MKKEILTYGKLLTISKNLCKSYYDSNERKFGHAVQSRDDEKNVIFSILKMSLNTDYYEYNILELKKAISISVDEANIKRISSYPPYPNTSND